MSIITGAYPGNVNAADLITLAQADPPGPRFRCHLLGDDTFDGGEARWDTLERPRRTSVLEWVGSDLHTLLLPLRLDGYGVLAGGANASVEPQVAQLLAWRRPAAGTTPPRPATVTVDGPVRQPPYRPWWVITKLAWGEQIRDATGARVMQEVEVTLMEHLQGDLLAGTAAQARARLGIA